MNKTYLYFIITFLVIISFFFRHSITHSTLYIFNNTNQAISNYFTNIKNSISNHFNQIDKINQLKEENKKLKNKLAQLNIIKNRCTQLKEFKELNISKVDFTQTISYASLPDMTSIYIDYNKPIKKPQGLIYNNETAGVVVKNIKNFSLAYLNNNSHTSYTVFIGKNKIPGVIFGGEEMVIKYIPKYTTIKKGDLVITSGLDKIFYEGVKVGIITKVIHENLSQMAIVKPFYNPLHPTFFYVVGN